MSRGLRRRAGRGHRASSLQASARVLHSGPCLHFEEKSLSNPLQTPAAWQPPETQLEGALCYFLSHHRVYCINKERGLDRRLFKGSVATGNEIKAVAELGLAWSLNI